jgi:glycosyltransferase involved in cell wall biosynthesis
VSDHPTAPLVSVIVCVYNGEEFLAAALDSALAQTYTDFELIAVNDGSTDRSPTILSRYSGGRVRVVRQENQGAGAALATGLRLSAGEYVAFLDQDDLWEKDKLAAHVDLLQRRPDIDLTFSWYRIIDRAGQPIGLRSHRYRGTIDFRHLLIDFVIGATSNVVARRSVIEKAGGVDRTLPRFYDLELFVRIALLGRANIAAIPRDLMLYRRHDSQISRDLGVLQKEWEQVLEKLRRIAPREVGEVESRARSNMCRYFARIGYENGQYRQGLDLLRDGLRAAPAHFLANRRNWWTGAACLCGLSLPPRLHRGLERLAGLRRKAPGTNRTPAVPPQE